jgi:hypothetical protein
MTEWTWWESMGTELAGAANRLCRLMHEGRVRRVQVLKDRQTVAEFPVDGDANEIVFASVIDAAHSAGPACTIRAELADLEAAHVAGLQTTVP